MYIKKEQETGIWVYENCFDVQNLIQMIEEESEKSWGYLSWVSSFTGSGDNYTVSEYRTSLEMKVDSLLEDNLHESISEIGNVFKSIFKNIDEAVWDYRECFDLQLNSHNGLQILKYYGGSEYHAHYDHAPDNSRVLSMVACLDDDFDGGELEFPFFKTKIKLKKGSVILFPSNFPYTHIAHPVRSGVKYSLVTWFV